MTMDVESGLGRRMVNLEQGTIRREIFVDPDIYRRELENIFTRAWLFVGHESQVPNPDDYFISRMGEESVILTRDRQGKLHVLLNTCTHRGMKVVRYDQGNTRTFSCPYHGWSFSTDGSLVSVPGELLGVPQYRAAYHEQLDKQEWGLIQVAQLANYKGSIWATWDPQAPSFFDYLGDMKIFLDAVLDHRDGREGGSELLGGIQKWRVPCNWKYGAENFIGDAYHNISHRSVDLVGIGPSGGRGRRDDNEMSVVRFGAIAFPELGHGALGSVVHTSEPVYVPTYQNDPEVAEYFRHVHEERKKNLRDTPRVLAGVGTIWPNCSYHGMQPRALFVWHPQGPREMEFWRFYLVDADAPQKVKDLLRHYYMRYSGPSGMTEQDDMENWNYATEASDGTIAQRKPYNYQLGLGWSEPMDLAGARWTGHVTEENARAMYGRWAQFMDANSWEDLAPVRR